MVIYTKARKATTMHVDDPLLYEFIRAAHDPDPLRAALFRPFASARRPQNSIPTGVDSAFGAAKAMSIIGKTVATVLGLIPVHRPALVPCC
jgi:hypothetical protein